MCLSRRSPLSKTGCVCHSAAPWPSWGCAGHKGLGSAAWLQRGGLGPELPTVGKQLSGLRLKQSLGNIFEITQV